MRDYFWAAFHGEPDYLPDNRTRVRWIMATVLRHLAKHEERSMASRMRWAAGRIEAGLPLTKKVMRQFDKRLQAIKDEFESEISRLT